MVKKVTKKKKPTLRPKEDPPEKPKEQPVPESEVEMTEEEHVAAEDPGTSTPTFEVEEEEGKKEETVEEVPKDVPIEVTKEAVVERKITGGDIANLNVREVDEDLLVKINASAEEILKCLPNEMARDFRIACYKDYDMKDLGIYFMGLLNRLYKTGDFYNPDIEPEWDKRVVGYSAELVCNFCKEIIVDAQNIGQLFCTNACAKKYKDKYTTGVLKPSDKDRGSEAEQDEIAWDREVRREQEDFF